MVALAGCLLAAHSQTFPVLTHAPTAPLSCAIAHRAEAAAAVAAPSAAAPHVLFAVCSHGHAHQPGARSSQPCAETVCVTPGSPARAEQNGCPWLACRFSQGVVVVPQQMAWVVERFGRFHMVLDPGLRFLVPVMHKVRYVFSLKEEALTVPSQAAVAACALFFALGQTDGYHVFGARKGHGARCSHAAHHRGPS